MKPIMKSAMTELNCTKDIDFFRAVYRLSSDALNIKTLSLSDKFTLNLAKKQSLAWFSTTGKSKAFTMSRELVKSTIERVYANNMVNCSTPKEECVDNKNSNEAVGWSW